MAVILRKSSPEEPGVIVLTHKEVAFLRSGSTSWRRWTRFKFSFGALIGNVCLTAIRKHYAVGVHIGSKLRNDHPALNDCRLDFSLSTPTLWQKPMTERVIPLVSAYFVPTQIENYASKERDIDLLVVATDAPYKNWASARRVANQILAIRPGTRITFVSSHSSYSREAEFRRSADEALGANKDKVTQLSSVVTDSNVKGLDFESVASLMGRAKVLALFSFQEGTPKVVTEALMAGARPVVYHELHMNSSYLPALNRPEFLMTEGGEAKELSKAIEAHNFESSQRYIELGKAHFSLEVNFQRLNDAISELVPARKNLDFLPDLRLQLPAHTRRNMPWLGHRPDGVRSPDLQQAKDWIAFAAHALRARVA